MSTTSAEEALQRAKAIATRLAGGSMSAAPTTVPNMSTAATADSSNVGAPYAAPTTTAGTSTSSSVPSTTTSGSKRKRWGVAAAAVPAMVAPVAAKSSSEALPGLSDAAKKLKEAQEPVSKRFWVTTTKERTEYHYFTFLPPKLKDLAKDVSKGKSKGERVSITLKGRGAKGTAPLPGVPEEPMNVVIEGPPDLVGQAESLVESVLDEAEKAPVTADGPLPPAPGAPPIEEDGPSSALTVQTSYRPATVAQLIANSGNPAAGMNGGNFIEEKIEVPNGIVGFVIGRGGETISSLQARTGCKVQIQKEHELVHGQTQRIITLSASTQEAINECRQLIDDMVQDRVKAAGGSNNNNSSNNSRDNKVGGAVAPGHCLVQIEVPDADVGLIIGKGGATIKMIQESTGSSIQIPPTGNVENPTMRTVSITSPSEEGAQAAKGQIEQLLSSKPTFSREQPTQITVQLPIPDKDVGLCIGRQGCVIKEMQRKSNTRIQIPSQPTMGQPHRVATVSGTQQGIEQVRAMIDGIISEQSSVSVMSGTPFGAQQGGHGPGNGNNYHGQGRGQRPMQQQRQPQQQQQPQQNSAEWQAFYAAQAVAGQQQQQMQQQQYDQTQQQQMQHYQQQNQATPAVAVSVADAAPAQGADQYYEQFFRYAYYYGEDAARTYYGAWSPPPGTPNPYGVNPNGITAAVPAQQAAAPAAPQAAPVSTAQTPAPSTQVQAAHTGARDTSMRKVSNLPAWMTRGK